MGDDEDPGDDDLLDELQASGEEDDADGSASQASFIERPHPKQGTKGKKGKVEKPKKKGGGKGKGKKGKEDPGADDEDPGDDDLLDELQASGEEDDADGSASQASF